jgi:hypothetical protein
MGGTSARPADVDEYPIGFEQLAVHAYCTRALEAPMAVVHRAVLEPAHPTFHSLHRMARDLILARFHPLHVYPHGPPMATPYSAARRARCAA